jgi:hypothetical protein
VNRIDFNAQRDRLLGQKALGVEAHTHEGMVATVEGLSLCTLMLLTETVRDLVEVCERIADAAEKIANPVHTVRAPRRKKEKPWW